MAIITLSTDFGRLDGYNGAVIGAIKSLAPQTEVVEISSELFSIKKASLVLWRYYSHFPPGTVHLVVVDPAVGTERRALAGTDGRYKFVGPDNGLFTPLYDEAAQKGWSVEVVKLTNPRYWLPVVSHTFHGRDVFAPAAAHLANGVTLIDLGRVIQDPA